MKLKPIVAAIAAVTLISPALFVEAKASRNPRRHQPSELVDRGVHPYIAQSLDNLGVPVFDGALMPGLCGDRRTDHSYVIAAYNRQYNAIVICNQNVSSNHEFIEGVTHEAVHVVQDCRTGLHNTTLSAGDKPYVINLYNALSTDTQDLIRNLYPMEKWDIEIEAFYFQGRPQAVANGLAENCF